VRQSRVSHDLPEHWLLGEGLELFKHGLGGLEQLCSWSFFVLFLCVVVVCAGCSANLPATSPETLVYFSVFGLRYLVSEELTVVRIARCLVNAILSLL